MKEVTIKAEIINSDNEPNIIEIKGIYNQGLKTLEYLEGDLKVNLKLESNKIILNRKNEDYDLNLEFELNKKVNCKYRVKSIGLDLELDVYTNILEIKENEIFVDYELFSENNSIGTFKYKLIYEE